MAVLLSKKQYVLSICYSILAALLLIFSLTLIVSEDVLGENRIYDGWIYLISMIAIGSLSAAVSFAFIGKKIPFLIFNLAYLCVTIISIVTSIMYIDLRIGLFITLMVIVLMIVVIIMILFSKRDDIHIKVVLSSKDVALNVGFFISMMLAYICMKLFKIVELYFDYYECWSFFGTFDKSSMSVSYYEAVMIVLMTLSVVLFWYKKNKAGFGVAMVYAVMFAIVFFINLDTPYRTPAFALVSIVGCCPIVFAIIKLKNSIKPDPKKKIEELDLLLKEGVISQEKYNEKVNALNEKTDN